METLDFRFLGWRAKGTVVAQHEVNMAIQTETEAFVTPEEAASFMRYSPITVKRLAREGKIPAHSVTNGMRRRWRFLISELAATMRKGVSLNHHPRRSHKEGAAHER